MVVVVMVGTVILVDLELDLIPYRDGLLPEVIREEQVEVKVPVQVEQGRRELELAPDGMSMKMEYEGRVDLSLLLRRITLGVDSGGRAGEEAKERGDNQSGSKASTGAARKSRSKSSLGVILCAAC